MPKVVWLAGVRAFCFSCLFYSVGPDGMARSFVSRKNIKLLGGVEHATRQCKPIENLPENLLRKLAFSLIIINCERKQNFHANILQVTKHLYTAHTHDYGMVWSYWNGGN